MIILTLVSVATYFWSKSIYVEQVEKNISQNIDALSVGLTTLDNIENIVTKLKNKTGLRITIINKEGVVIAESDKNKTSMGNHAKRYEIIHAQYEGFGKIIRYSDTLETELLYVAKKITLNNKVFYIRMADYLNNIQGNFIRLSLQIIAIFALLLIGLFIGTYFISKKLHKETDGILKFLIALTKREEITYIKSNYTVEFDKIARLLKKVAIRLSKKDKQKAKQTAKLKLANRQKDEIISAISHEFKNPIAVISGYSETLLNDEDLPESMKEKFLTKIHTNGNKMSTIIDRLRLAIKLDEGKESGTFTKCSIEKICLDVMSDLEPNYKDRAINIEGNDVIKNVDETLFTIAISNLIENALKYSENHITIKINEDSLSICDKGIGIEANELEKITKKFYRVSNNGWNNSLGLGLNIVFNILTLHKFTLEITSEIHVGSQFTIKY